MVIFFIGMGLSSVVCGLRRQPGVALGTLRDRYFRGDLSSGWYPVAHPQRNPNTGKILL